MSVLSSTIKYLAITLAVYSTQSLVVSPALAEFDRGEALYENHCTSCHETLVHTREGGRVTTRSELRKRVAAWSIHSGLGWSAEEVDDVTGFLTRRFYRFAD